MRVGRRRRATQARLLTDAPPVNENREMKPYSIRVVSQASFNTRSQAASSHCDSYFLTKLAALINQCDAFIQNGIKVNCSIFESVCSVYPSNVQPKAGEGRGGEGRESICLGPIRLVAHVPEIEGLGFEVWVLRFGVEGLGFVF